MIPEPTEPGFYEAICLHDQSSGPEIVKVDCSDFNPKDCLDEKGQFDWGKADKQATQVAGGLRTGVPAGNPLVYRFGTEHVYNPDQFYWIRKIETGEMP